MPGRRSRGCALAPALTQRAQVLVDRLGQMRNPTVKEESAAVGDRALSALLLTYPVHQAVPV